MGISCIISLNCDYHRDALIILWKTISIRHLGSISDPYTPLDHPIYLLIISLHLKIYWLTSMGLDCMISLNCDYHRDALIILSKTILIRHLGTISDLYTPSDHQIYLVIISFHLKIDCVSVYGPWVYDITKLRLLQGCVDYTVKNDLDSSSRHHFWPIYTFRSSNIFMDHFITSKNRLR